MVVGSHSGKPLFQYIRSIANQKSRSCPFQQIRVIIVIADGKNKILMNTEPIGKPCGTLTFADIGCKNFNPGGPSIQG